VGWTCGCRSKLSIEDNVREIGVNKHVTVQRRHKDITKAYLSNPNAACIRSEQISKRQGHNMVANEFRPAQSAQACQGRPAILEVTQRLRRHWYLGVEQTMHLYIFLSAKSGIENRKADEGCANVSRPGYSSTAQRLGYMYDRSKLYGADVAVQHTGKHRPISPGSRQHPHLDPSSYQPSLHSPNTPPFTSAPDRTLPHTIRETV